MDNFMMAFIVLIISIFVSRTINDRATLLLDDERKTELKVEFAKIRVYTFGVLLAIIVIFFINIKFHFIDSLVAYLSYIITLLGVITLSSYLSYKKLKEYYFPDSYIKSFLLSTFIRFLGLAIFFTLFQL